MRFIVTKAFQKTLKEEKKRAQKWDFIIQETRMESFVYSLNATVPVFLVMILGNVLHRIGLLPCSFSNAADKLVFKNCLPCMLYLELADTDIRKNFDGMYIGYCFFVTLFSIFLIWGFAKIFLKEKTSVGAFVQGAYRSSAAILGSVFISNIYGF